MTSLTQWRRDAYPLWWPTRPDSVTDPEAPPPARWSSPERRRRRRPLKRKNYQKKWRGIEPGLHFLLYISAADEPIKFFLGESNPEAFLTRAIKQ